MTKEYKLFYPNSNKNKISKTMLEESMNYLSVLFVENGITNSLSYEEAIKDYAAKICT